jgi:hypothetical protein
LIHELKSELSGRFEQAILGLLSTPAEFDAECLRDAMKVSEKTNFLILNFIYLS